MKTKKEFEKWFRMAIMPYIRDMETKHGGGLDRPLRREEWLNTIDRMIKYGELPERAYDWASPW